jgi:hypothetical protein
MEKKKLFVNYRLRRFVKSAPATAPEKAPANQSAPERAPATDTAIALIKVPSKPLVNAPVTPSALVVRRKDL